MDEEIIAHMRGRVAQVRRIMELAHDREMIRMLGKIIEEAEADLKRLEASEIQVTLTPPQSE